MKPLYSYALIAAFAAIGQASAATEATTTPVGYSSTNLGQGFNLVGLTLQTPAVASGTFDVVEDEFLSDADAVVTPIAGRTYILEIKSAPLVGVIQEIPAANIGVGGGFTTITTPQDLSALGLTSGASYTLRLAPTLEEVFGTTPLDLGGTLSSAINSTNSDKIWIPNGNNTYTKYYLHRSSNAFRAVSTNTASPNIPVVYTDAFYIEKVNGDVAKLTVSGEVKKEATQAVIVGGFNPVSIVAPVGLTLRTSGIEAGLKKAINLTNSDVVWVQKPDLTYSRYYYNSSAGAPGWRDAAAPTVALDPAIDPPLSTSILIEKRDPASANLPIAVPTSYTSL